MVKTSQQHEIHTSHPVPTVKQENDFHKKTICFFRTRENEGCQCTCLRKKQKKVRRTATHPSEHQHARKKGAQQACGGDSFHPTKASLPMYPSRSVNEQLRTCATGCRTLFQQSQPKRIVVGVLDSLMSGNTIQSQKLHLVLELTRNFVHLLGPL